MLIQKLRDLNLTLPPAGAAYGAYMPAKVHGNLLYVAGQLPRKEGQLIASGPVPSSSSVDIAREAARCCVLNALAAARDALGGDLDRLVGALRVGAFIASDPGFTQQPKVADAASELLVELLGPNGRHVRAAVGTNVLPANASVEIEFIFEIAP